MVAGRSRLSSRSKDKLVGFFLFTSYLDSGVRGIAGIGAPASTWFQAGEAAPAVQVRLATMPVPRHRSSVKSTDGIEKQEWASFPGPLSCPARGILKVGEF